MKQAILLAVLFAFSLESAMSQSANYTATRDLVDGIEVIRLADQARHTEVSIAPALGNNAYRMKVNGEDVFWSPIASPVELEAKPRMMGNPFLAPWANRIDGDAYFANGRRYLLNPALGNYRTDGNGLPIHGLLVYAPAWKVTKLAATAEEAVLTSRLEFWRYPEWMAQFPFAHNIEMTYRLARGRLEVETVIENVSAEPMPVSVGYHTYYRIGDAPRDDWRVTLAGRERLVLSSLLVPTGASVPVEDRGPLSLGATKLDDLFGHLIRDPQGRAVFSVAGAKQKISIAFGPKYTIGIVYAPPGQDFVCFEPMSGPTNAFNLAHSGAYAELQSIPPGEVWRESFWITPEGY